MAAAVDQAVHDSVTLTANTAHVYGGAVSLPFNVSPIFLLWYLVTGFARVVLIGRGS